MTDTQITDTSPMQLIVFERKTARSAYRYFGTYKAGDQAQLTASENTIRNTFAALHASDGVRWSVVACEASGLLPFFGLTKRVGRGRRSRRDVITLRSLDGLGVVALEFPEETASQQPAEDPLKKGVHVFDNGAELKRMLEADKCGCCDGTGVVTTSYPRGTTAREFVEETCQECNGTGVYAGPSDAEADRIEELDRRNWLGEDTLEDLRIAMDVEKVEQE